MKVPSVYTNLLLWFGTNFRVPSYFIIYSKFYHRRCNCLIPLFPHHTSSQILYMSSELPL